MGFRPRLPPDPPIRDATKMKIRLELEPTPERPEHTWCATSRRDDGRAAFDGYGASPLDAMSRLAESQGRWIERIETEGADD